LWRYRCNVSITSFKCRFVALDQLSCFRPYDNTFAIDQIQYGHQELLHRTPASAFSQFSRLITLGGDHTITLPLLRSIHSAYGPISVIHFDSHLDTWKPKVFGGAKSDAAAVNHGTYFWHASQEGLIKKGSSIHAGIRTTLSGPSDYEVNTRTITKALQK
jgi:agmatinase